MSQLKITVLGSGTSTGVPVIGCNCDVCLSKDPYNKRFRSSIAIENLANQKRLVIDTTPDFRSQVLQNHIKTLDAVLYTHTHADHCHGFDDLRGFYFTSKKPVTCFLDPIHKEEIIERFSYAFFDTGYLGTAPQVNVVDILDDPFDCIGLEVDPVRLPHGSVQTLAFRFGSFAYATDFKNFPEHAIQRWKGKIHTMIASGLHFTPHPAHSVIPETIELFNQLGVERGIITHLSHKIEHHKDAIRLPSHVSFAYDGQTIHLQI